MLHSRFVFLIAFCAVVSGCAGAPGVECHGTQWYRLGYEDGLADAKGERERYAASCSNDFNADQYQRGFQDGYSRRPKPAGETKVQ
jgi:hypothetical protein